MTHTRFLDSREAATRMKRRRYLDGAPCTDCGHSALRYTRSGKCVLCAIAEAELFFQAAKKEGAPLTPEDAIHIGERYFVKRQPCKLAGHVGETTLFGTCKQCEEGKMVPGRPASPRSAARSRGWSDYLPDTLCKNRLHRTKRRVTDDLCYECRAYHLKQQAFTRKLLQLHPCAVIDKETARFLSVLVYRLSADSAWLDIRDDSPWVM